MRGCGIREEGSLYFVCETSPLGRPIEDFLVDPPIPWKGPRLRAPMLQHDGARFNHVLIGVGARYYPFIPDFIEEAKIMGVSKRIPTGFDLSKLTPGRSKMALIHPRAIPVFEYTLHFYPPCPKGIRRAHGCIGKLWPLSALNAYRTHEVSMSGTMAAIKTPSVRYQVRIPKEPKHPFDGLYLPGLFLSVPITRIDYINSRRRVPRDIKKKVEKSGFKLEVLPE